MELSNQTLEFPYSEEISLKTEKQRLLIACAGDYFRNSLKLYVESHIQGLHKGQKQKAERPSRASWRRRPSLAV